ncbi:unnamed protein product, partial [Ectocarpus fasciculatus]
MSGQPRPPPRQQQDARMMPHPPRRTSSGRMPDAAQDSAMTPTAAAKGEAREPGALAPRQLPGNEESKNLGEAAAGGAAAFAASSSSPHHPEEEEEHHNQHHHHHQEQALGGGEAQDFGYGNSFGACIPLLSSPGSGASGMMATGSFLAGRPPQSVGAEESRRGGGENS